MVSRHQVLRPFDEDIVAERGLEHLELCTAQTAAGARRVGDRAVVLDEEHRSVGLGDSLGEVALVGTAAGQAFGSDLDAGRASVVDDGAVGRQLRRGASIEHGIQRVVAETGAQRVEQLDREVGVAIGKDDVGKIGKVPGDGRPPPSRRGRRRASHEPGHLQGFEVLADGGVRQPEGKGELGRRRRLDALQALEDAALGGGQLRVRGQLSADLLAAGPSTAAGVAHRQNPISNIRTSALTKYVGRTSIQSMSLRNESTSEAQVGWMVAGVVADLERDGRLLTKVGHLPVVVVRSAGQDFAIEDRCPHLGFPLHEGTVEAGMITCHWHHARFDLSSGCTLDPWADDAIGFEVAVDGDHVLVRARHGGQSVEQLRARLRDGLEHGITLVVAKAILGLVEANVEPAIVVGEAARFGLANRADGWSSGMTTLVALANLVPLLDPADRALALVHGVAEVARSTAGRPPRFGERPMHQAGVPNERLVEWYRRFVETRVPDAAERALATLAVADPLTAQDAAFAAVTDHVFIDEGHTLDFVNKAVELVELLGPSIASDALTSLVGQACAADRAEESSPWQHPVDLRALVASGEAALAAIVIDAPGAPSGPSSSSSSSTTSALDVAALGWTIVEGEPAAIVDAIVAARRAGASGEELGRAVAFSAALRLVRFHTRNDIGDWDTVHHAMTTANGLHRALARRTTPELLRAVLHVALRVYLDRFLNVPAARLPVAGDATFDELAACWDRQGDVDRAGQLAFRLALAGDEGRRAVIAALGHALVQEDAGFHAYQIVEAGARHALTWPAGSQESALTLAGVARFLAAHTPTRRERAQIVRTASMLRRGEPLYEDA